MAGKLQVSLPLQVDFPGKRVWFSIFTMQDWDLYRRQDSNILCLCPLRQRVLQNQVAGCYDGPDAGQTFSARFRRPPSGPDLMLSRASARFQASAPNLLPSALCLPSASCLLPIRFQQFSATASARAPPTRSSCSTILVCIKYSKGVKSHGTHSDRVFLQPGPPTTVVLVRPSKGRPEVFITMAEGPRKRTGAIKTST